MGISVTKFRQKLENSRPLKEGGFLGSAPRFWFHISSRSDPTEREYVIKMASNPLKIAGCFVDTGVDLAFCSLISPNEYRIQDVTPGLNCQILPL